MFQLFNAMVVAVFQAAWWCSSFW